MRSWVITVGLALLHLGCAEQQLLLDRGPTSGVSPCFFWPPPRSSAMWPAPSAAKPGESLGTVAGRLEAELQTAGYAEQRWYPIGTSYEHGFAVTTRLEQLEGS